eukprot:g10246.t1
MKGLLPGGFPRIPGYDVAGVVETQSARSTLPRGTRVLAFLDHFYGGGYAEFATCAHSSVIAIPDSMPFEEAAALPLAGSTALQSLRDEAELKKGDRVLINGATGGVGAFAVQIAVAREATVTAVASGKHEEFARSLGAAEFIDYEKQDFATSGQQWNVIFDAAGQKSFHEVKDALASDGTYVSTEPSLRGLLVTMMTWPMKKQGKVMLARSRDEDLRELLGLYTEGQLKIPSLYKKGAGLVPSLAFLLASTNLVIELGILIAVFLSWQFVVAEYLGGLLLILCTWLIVKLTLPRKLDDEARDHVGHEEDDKEAADWKERLTSLHGWKLVARQYFMEWGMVWRDVLFGFTIAGIISAFVPASFFATLFVGSGSESDPGFGQILLQTIVGPVAAFFTFIGSMGNIPLAALLFANGVSFAGIMAFIFSDLVVFPVLRISAQYFGWKMAIYILAVFLAALIASALVLHYGFVMVDLIPQGNVSAESIKPSERFRIDYTFWLNLVFLTVMGGFTWLRFTGIGQPKDDSHSDDGHDHDQESETSWPDMLLTAAAWFSIAWLAGGTAGKEIALRIDQTLTQDATGTLVMLELEATGVDRVQTELSAQYVDHNLIQQDFKNPDDHLFLESACRRFGIWYSRPGNGVSHPVHQQRFGIPGKTLLGSDSHTPAAGALGMLAFGAGGIDIAMAMAGMPYRVEMPRVWFIHLSGRLPVMVSAKDVILEMLRRHDVDGAVGYVLEYGGPGLKSLSVMDRHVIANMGAELGATSTVFPSDDEVQRFLHFQGRDEDWSEWIADPGCEYDRIEEIDLSAVEPLVALPSSPGNVKPVREVAGREIYQAYLGSSANPGFEDFAVAAEIVNGRSIHPRVSFDVNPTSRQLLLQLLQTGDLGKLIAAGARLHQAGCNGCIGMGQAPATGKLSLRTVPRNFPGRSGTPDDLVCLVSPETAAVSALKGMITDPREHETRIRRSVEPPRTKQRDDRLFAEPISVEDARSVKLIKGPNIVSLPEFESLPDQLEIPVLLKVGDNISTDEILPAGTRVLPYRSNIPRIAEFAFEVIDDDYPTRSHRCREEGFAGHAVVGGSNYGQGSSREHAALAPRYLGLRVVLAVSFARIHRQNLMNFGIVPLTFCDKRDYCKVDRDDRLQISDLDSMHVRDELQIQICSSGKTISARHSLSPRQLEIVSAGGVINQMRRTRKPR